MATLQNGALDCMSLEMKCICGWRDLSVHIFWCDRTDRAGTNRRACRSAANWAPSARFIPVVCFIHPLEVSLPSLRHPSSGCPPFTGLLESTDHSSLEISPFMPYLSYVESAESRWRITATRLIPSGSHRVRNMPEINSFDQVFFWSFFCYNSNRKAPKYFTEVNFI